MNNKLLAQAPIRIIPGDQFSGLNSVSVTNLISAFVIISLIIASISFVFSLIIAGIKWILSGGKKERVEEAKNQIINALIGLLIVFSAWAVVNFIGVFFGVNLFVFNMPSAVP